MSEPNIFDFATSELSHSAFWAWVLRCTDLPADCGRLARPRALGRALLARVGIHGVVTPVVVKTEQPIDRRSRLDIEWRDAGGQGQHLVVENKVSALVDRQQLKRYEASLPSSARRMVVCTSAPEDLPERVHDWVCLDLPRVVALVAPHQGGHDLLDAYYDWAHRELESRLSIDAAILDGDAAEFSEAFNSHRGQWVFLQHVTQDFEGHFRRGVNLGGRRWTQKVVGVYRSEGGKDEIFYRVDRRKNGPYLALRQGSWDDKQGGDYTKAGARLKVLRAAFRAAVERAGGELRLGRPSNKGKAESDIAIFWLRENSIEELRQRLVEVHDEFRAAVRLASQ